MFSGSTGILDVLLLLSGHALFVGFWFSGSAKAALDESRAGDRGVRQALDVLVNSKAFGALQLLIALVMVLPLPAHLQWVGHGLGIAIVGLGLILRLVSRKRGCNCFGVFTPSKPGATLSLQVAMLLALVFRWVEAPQHQAELVAAYPTLVWLPGVLVALALSSHASARARLPVTMTQMPAQGRPAPQAGQPAAPVGVGQAAALKHMDPAFQLGTDASGKPVTVADVAQVDRPLFIAGFHDNCDGCRRLLPDYCALAAAFGADFPVVALTNRRDLVPQTQGLITVVDEGHRVNRELGIDFSPFGLLVNGADFRVMAPAAGGENAIRMLFAITLNARLPGGVK